MTPAEMKALVGQEVGVSSWYEITQERIDTFARATEDTQFIHTDPAAAKQSPFGGTIAHGYLTLSMLSVMSYECMPPLDGMTMGVNYGLDRVRFVSPVPAGSRIRGRFVLADLDDSVPGEVTHRWQVTVEIEGQQKPALVAEWINRRYWQA